MIISRRSTRSSITTNSETSTDVTVRRLVAKLVVVEGPRKGEEIAVDAAEVTLGRSRRADLFLDDKNLSRFHARIVQTAGGYRVSDLGSRHGLFVNGVRVLEHPLSSFDRIELGGSKLEFLVLDPTALPVPASTEEGEATRSLELVAPPPPVVPRAAEVPPEWMRPRLAKGALVAGALVVFLAAGLLLRPGPAVHAPLVAVAPPALSAPAPLDASLGRQVEGHYRSAQREAEQGRFAEAIGHLRRVHEYLPEYKRSRELMAEYGRKLRDESVAAARAAGADEKQDLRIYLDEGIEYLKEGDFERASDDFNSAIVLDPTNPIAVKGLRAAEAKVRSLDAVREDADPEEPRRQLVAALLERAQEAFRERAYQKVIDTAEQIQRLPLRGDTAPATTARELAERARERQKEAFEPFLVNARELLAQGDYNASRDLCEMMVRQDPSFAGAQDCLAEAKWHLNRLARDAYTYCYILGSINLIDEARQFCTRAGNYTREGDEYYLKIKRRLDGFRRPDYPGPKGR